MITLTRSPPGRRASTIGLDVDLGGPVDHDLGDGRVGEQRLEHAEADRLVDHSPDQPRALDGREHRALGGDHPADHALQAGAPLRLRQLRELGEVDLLEQPAAVVADAVAPVGGVVLRVVGCDPISQSHACS
jgi:hypothetical protein